MSYKTSERKTFLVLGFNRRTIIYQPIIINYEAGLTAKIIEFATRNGRYECRRVKAMLMTL